jgi:hypothetical protein
MASSIFCHMGLLKVTLNSGLNNIIPATEGNKPHHLVITIRHRKKAPDENKNQNQFNENL